MCNFLLIFTIKPFDTSITYLMFSSRWFTFALHNFPFCCQSLLRFYHEAYGRFCVFTLFCLFFVCACCNFAVHVYVIMQIQTWSPPHAVYGYLRFQAVSLFIAIDAYRFASDTLMACAYFCVICDAGKRLKCRLMYKTDQSCCSLKWVCDHVDMSVHMKPLSHDFKCLISLFQSCLVPLKWL